MHFGLARAAPERIRYIPALSGSCASALPESDQITRVCQSVEIVSPSSLILKVIEPVTTGILFGQNLSRQLASIPILTLAHSLVIPISVHKRSVSLCVSVCVC